MSLFTFQVFIKTVDSRTLTIDVGERFTVPELKQAVQQAMHARNIYALAGAGTEVIEVHDQVLLYAGRKLDDQERVGKYELARESTLHCFHKDRLGAQPEDDEEDEDEEEEEEEEEENEQAVDEEEEDEAVEAGPEQEAEQAEEEGEEAEDALSSNVYINCLDELLAKVRKLPGGEARAKKWLQHHLQPAPPPPEPP